MFVGDEDEPDPAEWDLGLPSSFDARAGADDCSGDKPFERVCAHCSAVFEVGLRFQGDIPPDSAWNICPECVRKLAEGEGSDAIMDTLGLPPTEGAQEQ